jgi:hypothetical protein
MKQVPDEYTSSTLVPRQCGDAIIVLCAFCSLWVTMYINSFYKCSITDLHINTLEKVIGNTYVSEGAINFYYSTIKTPSHVPSTQIL